MAQSSPGQALPLKQNMNKLTRQAIVAGILGNALEWYDFALYGHFSVFIGKTFFPSEQPDLALLAAFAVFSVSFCMRPIGALIFSAMGDRYGRKRALSLSMLGMAIPTAGIGLLPPYADIGVAATAILVILRLFQGLSLGGEMGGAVTYVMEHTPPERTGFASALIQASTCGGLLLGSLISGGLSLMLTDAAFNDWGWRVPFILGLVAAGIGIRIRRDMPESALYELARSEERLLRNPVRTLFLSHKQPLVLAIALLAPMTCCFFLIFVYFNSFMMAELHLPASQALLLTSLALTLSLLATLLGGWWADRLGYRRVLATGVGTALLAVLPVMSTLATGWTDAGTWPALFGFALLIGLYTSPVFAAVASLFPTEIRYSGVSFAVNIASPLFGSTVPLLATWVIHRQGAAAGFTSLGVYIMVLFGLAGIALYQIWSGERGVRVEG